jgi:preprotein translocase subunit SecD
MLKSLKVRLAITAVVFLVALYFLLPTLVTQIPSPWNNYFPKDKIHLGLDLQGGMHLILEVDADKALESMMERTANDLKESLMDGKVRFRNVEKCKQAPRFRWKLDRTRAEAGAGKISSTNSFRLEIASSTRAATAADRPPES